MNNLTDIDHEILLHRDAHFEGDFAKMLSYYKKNGKGVNPDFDLERILQLFDLERDLNINLSDGLDEEDKAKISHSLKAYDNFKTLSHKKNKNMAALLAELILSNEENPPVIDEIINRKAEAVKPLIDILRDEDYYDPLFPGFGLMPNIATEILGKIGDKRAIIALFEEINRGDFFDDEIIFKAFKGIGDPAEEFLLKVLHAKPFTVDNEKAAQALHVFNDEKVAKSCFELLKSLDFKKDSIFAGYLIYNCEPLLGTPEENAFRSLAESDKYPKNLKPDFNSILQSWHKKG